VFLYAYNGINTGSIKSVKLILEVEEGGSNVYFKVAIESACCSYMLYKSIHMKFGTMLFRRGIDILISLSWALSSQQFSDEDSENDQNPAYTSVRDNKVVLYEAGYIVNDLIHKEIEKQSTSRKIGLTGDHDLRYR